ncbi:endonuclease MutS2 [Patiriisocius sp. Uisw_017]|uniref:endonuclease MutS2 n=1 Tax=Patiriisocius sp. Uisw_017 TaxID=3230968 RepID=UPI0039EB9A38
MVKIDKKTLQDLEFPAVLEQVAEYCITVPGKERIAALTPFEDLADVIPQLQAVKEFTASLGSDAPIPNHGFDPIFKELKLLGIENSTLEISSFRRILQIVETIQVLLKFFKKYQEFYIQLNHFSEAIFYHPEIATQIHAVFDKYGEVKDEASPQLGIIRRRLNSVKGQINSSFTKALTKYASSDYLDEIRETVVENRRVLAVKAMHRRKVKGTVLGTSKTGRIVYMEPQETFEFTTELSNLVYEESEEVKRILKELTEFVRPFKELLTEYQEYLIATDATYSKAKYAVSINAVLPIITKERRLHLIDAFHPLLYISNTKRKEKTYSQSISLVHEDRIIVISGPNAGGKSITLKTVGLLQMLLQSGMLIPVDPQSELCFFDRILTDIGDNQSIENHLSTYSYRLKKMNQFLKKCNNKTLFLIDEFGTGSDPELGGALAESFLEVFYEREAFGIITTHYANLKLLASELPNASNANMLFDSGTLEPLYKLYLGEAGSSFTFEVAQKNGIPYSLINKAKKKVARGKIRFDKSIADLQKERAKLRRTSETLESSADKAKKEEQQLKEINIKLQDKLENYQELYDSNQKLLSIGKKFDTLSDRYHNNKKKKSLLDELFKMVLVENSKRKKIAPKQKQKVKAKERITEQEVEKKVKVIRERKQKEKAELKKAPPPKPKVTLKIGDRVRMLDGKAIGTIDTIEKKKAIVNYGMFTTNVSLEALEKV